MVVPMPMATPLTAAMTGLAVVARVSRKRIAGDTWPGLAAAKSAMSLPAVKQSSVSPITMARTLLSLSAARKASVIPVYIVQGGGVFFFGRVVHIVWSRSLLSTLYCVVF